MLRLLIDQDLNQHILRGLRRRIPTLDAVTAHEIGLHEASDPELLAWAAGEGRAVVTHDRTTMTGHAAARVGAGEKMSGVFVVPRRLALNDVINDLEMIIVCSQENEWDNVIRYLPL